MKKTVSVIISIVAAVILVSATGCESCKSPELSPTDIKQPAKPVIYLYPDATSEVTVKLRYNGILDFTYPAYDDGWHVTA
ncbi:MAG: hypothetical protein FWD30_03410, partial [Dehalococcoidia bacterium]|nr:hypothetical protein [Dehalococcoidia bacterium]